MDLKTQAEQLLAARMQEFADALKAAGLASVGHPELGPHADGFTKLGEEWQTHADGLKIPESK